ncbi:unnamed protein product [Thlaspi arvense]|uniref:Ubiquitin-like domain-containing protein n=1 Tax=Thlaspi arvense TaxID=13288 RepID=A0AAU9RQ04_THLAR|nr:unnamed protein product [Thlaspi arvense]
MAKLKFAGTWGGIIEVELENWTLTMLRDEVAKRSGLDSESIKLICAGKILKDNGDDTQTLAQLGIKENSKILSSRGAAPEEGKSIMAEEERARRLSRVK